MHAFVGLAIALAVIAGIVRAMISADRRAYRRSLRSSAAPLRPLTKRRKAAQKAQSFITIQGTGSARLEVPPFKPYKRKSSKKKGAGPRADGPRR